jgi:hypothetical protein
MNATSTRCRAQIGEPETNPPHDVADDHRDVVAKLAIDVTGFSESVEPDRAILLAA